MELRKTQTMNGQILERIAGGESQAMQECIDTYGNLVWGIARRFFSNSIAAEDIVQEIFTEIWKKASTFDSSKAGESTFIAMIARRRTIDAYRKVTRRPMFEELSEMEVEENPAPSPDQSSKLDSEYVAGVMSELSDVTRQLIELSVRDGFTHQELAEKMGLPLGTVKTRIRRGLLDLRQKIQSRMVHETSNVAEPLNTGGMA